jgi:hypothetical protein
MLFWRTSLVTKIFGTIWQPKLLRGPFWCKKFGIDFYQSMVKKMVKQAMIDTIYATFLVSFKCIGSS